MSDAKEDKSSNYSFDLARMAEAVEGKDSDEVIVLKGPMTGAEIHRVLEAAYYQLITQEGSAQSASCECIASVLPSSRTFRSR